MKEIIRGTEETGSNVVICLRHSSTSNPFRLSCDSVLSSGRFSSIRSSDNKGYQRSH